MDITVYAPVLIPTLNRYEHFCRCLESLEKCTGADKTEVFVALDFPPSEKYRAGWEKIDHYLAEKEANNGFGQLHVIRREHNYGVGTEHGNADTLIADTMDKYDRYIFTEDDNEFSPCFLQYMNKALTKFYNDERVFLVCGYNPGIAAPDAYTSNYYITRESGSPWGLGEWTYKRRAYQEYYLLEKLKELLKNKQTYLSLKKKQPHCIDTIISQIKRSSLYGDAIKGVYSTLFDKYCIMPAISLVRNWGFDGQGVHAQKNDEEAMNHYSHQEISQDRDFYFSKGVPEVEPGFIKEAMVVSKKTLRDRYKSFVRIIDVWLFRHLNYIPKSKFI